MFVFCVFVFVSITNPAPKESRLAGWVQFPRVCDCDCACLFITLDSRLSSLDPSLDLNR